MECQAAVKDGVQRVWTAPLLSGVLYIATWFTELKFGESFVLYLDARVKIIKSQRNGVKQSFPQNRPTTLNPAFNIDMVQLTLLNQRESRFFKSPVSRNQHEEDPVVEKHLDQIRDDVEYMSGATDVIDINTRIVKKTFKTVNNSLLKLQASPHKESI